MSSGQRFDKSANWTKVKDLLAPCPARRSLYERFSDARVRVVDDAVVDDLTGYVGATFELRGVARVDDEFYSLCFHARTPEEFPYAFGFACHNFATPPAGNPYAQPPPEKLPADWPWLGN